MTRACAGGGFARLASAWPASASFTPTPTLPTSAGSARSCSKSTQTWGSPPPRRAGRGTSTDVCLVEGAQPQLTREGRIGPFPVRVPMIDIVSVGTGGGSVAWVGPDGGLRVGPRSAGADPGPMAYGRGGDQPTVTDAALVVGRLPSRLAGGEVSLDSSLSERGLDRIAEELGLDRERAAAGVLELSAHNQANA